jgi:hypothetical protein
MPLFAQALKIAPEWGYLRGQQVTILARAGRAKEALALADAAARRRATPGVGISVGLAHYYAGDAAAGVAALRASGSDAPQLRLFLAPGLAAQGKVEEALAALAPLQDQKGDRARAQVHAYAGRLRAGLAAMESAARRPGADVSFTWQAAAAYLAAAGDLEAARTAAARGDFFTVVDAWVLPVIGDERRLGAILPELAPEKLPEGRLVRALEVRRKGDRARALAELRDLDRGGATFVPYFHGLLAAESGRDEEAVAAFRRFEVPVLSGFDAYAAPWLLARARYLMGRSLDRLGRRDEARAVLDLQLGRWKDADADLPLLAEMKALRASLGTAPVAK